MRIYKSILLLASLYCFSQWSLAKVPSAPISTIEVFGAEEVMTVPDQFSFSLSLQEKGKQAAKLNQQISQRSAEVVSALVAIGIKPNAIQSLQVQFNPWIEYINKEQVQKGFSLTRTISVTVNSLSDYEQAIDKVLTLGVEQVYAFEASNSQPQKAYQLAMQSALLNAKAQATDMAATLGLKIGKVIAISELSNAQVRPRYAMARQANMAESYQAGEISTDAKVKVTFGLINN
ncbi:SIMPL domain-containing protein [Paraglaciecola aestuariivivens]